MGNVLSKPVYYRGDLNRDYPCKKRKITHYENSDLKVRSFRMQEEFGPKKFIKP